VELHVEHREDHLLVRGEGGRLRVPRDDKLACRLLMILQAECGKDTHKDTAARYGCCKQTYYQWRAKYHKDGALALASHKRGPRRNYRRGGEALRQIVRHRFLDPEASADVIAQKLRQDGLQVSTRSVYRVLEDFGLQKRGSTRTGRALPGSS
jgi:transposase